jgi:hypothetical protein
MTRVTVAAVAALGLTAGVAAAELVVGPAAVPTQALPALGALGLAGLVVAVIVTARRDTGSRRELLPRHEARQRIRSLAAKGERADMIARETGVPRDVVVMVLRASGDMPVVPAKAAASAAPGRRRGTDEKVLLRA